MSNLIVYKASAGSGKTHRLTEDYLKMAFESDFRKILAVTFTNKATAEMKGRILEELHKLSRGEKSDFADIAGGTPAAAKLNASALLENILQKYAWFSVSTIDSFLSGIFKSFLLEVGVSSIYDIELNQDVVLEKMTDRLFDHVEENPELKNWLSRFARERIEGGRKWELKREIMQLGAELFKESYKLIDEDTKRKFADKSFLNEYRKELRNIQNHYSSVLKKAGLLAMQKIHERGLSAPDFKQGARGIYGLFKSWSEGAVKEPNSYAMKCLDEPDEWLSKGGNAQAVETLRDELLMKLFQDTYAFFLKNKAVYKTSEAVLNHFHAIGILGDLSVNLQELTREENKILLSEAAALLRDIVGENDASFVFEKAGNLYLNFMVDEFQDTSLMQWKTLMPLVKNGLSENGRCRLVGDVKQSIYRWRNGDWELLAGKALEDLKPFPGETAELETNWRSAPEVIRVNNFLFSSLPQILQSQYQREFMEAGMEDSLLNGDPIEELYRGEPQKVSDRFSASRGFVRFYCPKKDKSLPSPAELVRENLPGVISSLLDKGFRLRDIAILVRRRAEGDLVTRVLREYTDNERRFDFISDENLYLDESSSVYILLSALRYLSYPGDRINLTSLAHAWSAEKGRDEVFGKDFPSSFRQTEDVLLKALPEQFVKDRSRIRQLSPLSMCEEIIHLLALDEDPSASPYLMAFMDQVLQFSSSERGSTAAFLDWWEENKDKCSLSVNEHQDAIRVLTIHKSKGLQFRVVIVPFCDWALDHDSRKNNIIWCRTHEKPFDRLEKVPVKYSSKLADTLFSADYFHEKQKAFIDNLNLLYVALTRAEQGLIVFAPYGEPDKGLKTCGDLLNACLSDPALNDSGVGFSLSDNVFGQEGLSAELGEIHSEWKTSSVTPEDSRELRMGDYPFFPYAGRLVVAYQGKKYAGADESGREEDILKGQVMHELFSLIRTKSDIEKAVDMIIAQGKRSVRDREGIILEIKELLNDPVAGEWFDEGWDLFNEMDILVPGKGVRRPDRVMVKGTKAVVVDYKFGLAEDRKYEKQVKEYCQLLRMMGYQDVQGFIWYLELRQIKQVI